MRGVFLILELFVSIFLTAMGVMFLIMEVTDSGPIRLEQVALAAAFIFVGLALGSRGFRGLRTRGLLLAGLALFGLTALAGLLALIFLGVAVWLVVFVLGLLGVLSCLLRLRGLG
jgi:hypothetical protein